MKDNCSKYLGVVTSAGASDEHPMSTRSASDGRRWHSRGMQVICTLVLLFTFAIGNVWGADKTGSISLGYGAFGKTSQTNVSTNDPQDFDGTATLNSTDVFTLSVTVPKGGSLKSGNVYIYQKTTGSLTVTAPSGSTMSKIEAVFSSGKVNTVSTTPTNTSEIETTSTKYTWEGSSNSVTFTLAAGNSTNTEFKSMNITYASSSTDVTAPTLSGSVPDNGDEDVAVSGTIVLTFSEAIATVDGSKFNLTNATKGTVAIDGTDSKKVNVSYSGAANSATVTLSVAADAVADAAGNKSAALSNISFTTIAASGGGDPEPRNLFTINMTATSETSITHGTKVELTSTYGTVTGGYTVLYNKHSSDDSKLKVNSNGISISGNDPCVILYLNEPLHVGDKIEFTSSVDKEIKIGVADDKDVTLAQTSSKSYTVASEGLASKQVIYLWRVSSTTNIKTLTISSTTTAPTFRTVTFDPNYTGSQTFTRTPADGTKIVYVPKDPVNGTSEFEGWFEAGASTAFDFSTAITADKTLTAHWSAPVTKHKVAYYDGSTKVGEEEVVENASPVNYANYQAKVLHSFTNWKNNADAVIDPASLVVTKDTALYAHWAKVYIAQDANYVFENTTTVGTAPNAITVTKDNKPNAIAADSRIDNMWLSAMSVKLEDGTYPGSGDDFYGWKINTSGATIRFYVENDCRVTVTVGNLTSGLNITYTGKSAAEEATTALTAKQANNYDVKGGTLVTLTTQGGNTVTLKGIAVAEIPALSDDATLSDLKVGGTTISGFSASKLNYYVQLPYGATSAPAVTATENEEHADVEIVDASAPFPSETTITVTAEDGVHKKVYTVHFILEPKQGVELMKALASANDNSAVAGYYSGTYSNGGHKGATVKMEKNYTFGLVLPEGKSFKEGDLFIMNITTAPGSATAMGTMKVYDAADASTPIFESSEVGIVGLNAWALPAAAEGKTALYIKRGNGDDWNPTFSYIGVQRYMAPFIESFEIAGVDAFEIEGTNITASVANSFDVTALTPTVKYWGNGGGAIDKTGAQNFTNPVQYTVSSAYADDATGDYAPVTYTVTITKVVPSEEPTITTQPQGANYIEGASIADLKVVAESTSGTLSYQWQIKNGLEFEDIDGATAASYTPTVSAIGSYVYRVVVTNTEDSKPATSVNSNEATIVIAEDPSCKAIGYGAPRALALNTEAVIDVTAGLKHKSSKDAVEGGRKIKDVNNIDGIKLDGGAYYDIYTTEMNIGSIGVSLTSNSNGTKRKFAMIFCSTASFDANKILGIVEQTGGAGDEVQVINSPEVPLGTKLVRIMRYYKDAQDNEYGEGSSSWIYYLRACLVEPAQEVVADVTAEPASANYCPNDVVASLAYELTMETGASAAYQWYKGTEAIEGATAATYTPSETGVYTCKAAVTKTGRLPKNLTSAEATVNFYEATAITAHADAIGDVDAEKTVSVTAEGTNLSYQWQACDENGVVTVETVLGTAASMNVTIAAEAKYYLATVTGACGVETQVVVVREWHEVAPANVTGSRTWDWSAAGMGEIPTASGSVEYLMANVSSKVPNTEAFRSDMLYITANYANRGASNKFFQGWQIRFYTEVPGKVSLECRAIHEKVSITINGTVIDAERGSSMTPATTPFLVPAGWVTIVFDNISTGQYADEPARVQKIVFNAEPDHKRENVVIGNMGTVCLPNPSRAFGVKVYELAGKGEGCKVQFDELAENEVLEAGKAYVLVMTDTKAKFFYTSTENPVTEADWTTAMKGNLNEEAIHFDPHAEAARNVVFFKDNAMWNAYETGLNVKQYRAYLQYDEVGATTSAPAPGRRRISLDMNGANVATGMENVQGNEVQSTKVLINGELFIIRGEKMYDATGRLVK